MYLHRFFVGQEAYTLAVLGYQMAHNRQLFLSPFTEEEIGTGRSNNLSKFTQLSKGQSWDLNPESLGPEYVLLVTVFYFLSNKD